MLKYIVDTVMLWFMATYYAVIVYYGILKDVFRLGFGKVFQWKQFSRPSCLDDPTLGTHGFLHIEEVKIHYVASGPEDKPLMLCLHGFPDFWYSWRYQIKEFQKDYRVVAIDLRGYGDSDKPSGINAYTQRKLESDVKQVILALGYKSCILVGHDWGGVIAFSLSHHFPEMVDRLIVMNTCTLSVFQRVIQTDKEQPKKSWYVFFFQLPFLPEFNFKCKNFEFLDVLYGLEGTAKLKFTDRFHKPMTQEDIDAYKYTFSQPGAVTPAINYYRAAFGRPTPDMFYDMNYTMPILLIWGCKDYCMSNAMVDLMEKEDVKITVKRIAEAGHFPQMDTPDQVNNYMREWLAEQGKD